MMTKSGRRYDIGFGKPPAHGRFKPGQSGNPRGRPKGSRNRVPSELEDNRLRAIIDEEANRMITIHDANGRKKKITTKRGVVRAISVNALKGQQRSQRHFTELVGENERIGQREREVEFETWLKYKRAWSAEFARCRSTRMAEPDQLPHPDDVVLDLVTGTVSIAGPAIKEEKVSWARWRKIRSIVEKELKKLHALRDDPNFRDSKELLTVIAATKETLNFINLALGGARAVMKFIEKLDLTNVEQAIRLKQRRGAKRVYISTMIHAAAYNAYKAQTG